MALTRHDWERNSPSKGLATCNHCGFVTKSWRINKGGLPKCLGVQRKLFEPPPCTRSRPPQACFICPGRYKEEICDQLRGLLNNEKPLETPLSQILA